MGLFRTAPSAGHQRCAPPTRNGLGRPCLEGHQRVLRPGRGDEEERPGLAGLALMAVRILSPVPLERGAGHGAVGHRRDGDALEFEALDAVHRPDVNLGRRRAGRSS